MAFNAAEQSGYQSTYGSGLGPIYQFGAQNPYGPYAGLQKAPGVSAPGAASHGSSSVSGSAGPTDAASQFFNSVLSGQRLPYDQETQGSLYSTASDMSAQAEKANNDQATAAAQRGGASANDPSLQGQRASAMSQRQGQNIRSKQDISSKANVANFGAQNDAANALQQANFEQQRINSGNMNALMPYSRGGQGGSSGGNNFTGSGAMGYFSSANTGDFRAPQAAQVKPGGTNTWSEADWNDAFGEPTGGGATSMPYMNEDYVPNYG